MTDREITPEDWPHHREIDSVHHYHRRSTDDARPSEDRLRETFSTVLAFTDLLVSNAPATDELWAAFVSDWLPIEARARAALTASRPAPDTRTEALIRDLDGAINAERVVNGDGTVRISVVTARGIRAALSPSKGSDPA